MRKVTVKRHKRKGKTVRRHKRKIKKRAWLDDEDIPSDLPETGFLGGSPILAKDKSGYGWDVPGGRRVKSSRNIYKVEYDPERHQPINKRTMVRKRLFFPSEDIMPEDEEPEVTESFEDMMQRRKSKNMEILGYENYPKEEREMMLNLPGFADREAVEKAVSEGIASETQLARSKRKQELEDKYGW